MKVPICKPTSCKSQGRQTGQDLEAHLLQEQAAPEKPGHGHQHQGRPQMEPERGGGITVLEQSQAPGPSQGQGQGRPQAHIKQQQGQEAQVHLGKEHQVLDVKDDQAHQAEGDERGNHGSDRARLATFTTRTSSRVDRSTLGVTSISWKTPGFFLLASLTLPKTRPLG